MQRGSSGISGESNSSMTMTARSEMKHRLEMKLEVLTELLPVELASKVALLVREVRFVMAPV